MHLLLMVVFADLLVMDRTRSKDSSEAFAG